MNIAKQNRKERRARKANKTNPREVFSAASGYLAAYVALSTASDQSDQQLSDLIMPKCAIHALSTEIYLKCLILVESGKLHHHHDLARLYALISQESKDRIEKEWEDYWIEQPRRQYPPEVADNLPDALKEPRSLKVSLRASRHAHEIFRYIYEPDKPDAGMFIHPLPWFLHKLILEKHPEWLDSYKPMTFYPFPKISE